MVRILLSIWLVICAGTALAQQDAREFDMQITPELAETGLLDYILPRFALKNARRARVVNADTNADAVIGPMRDGARPVFARQGVTYGVTLRGDNGAAAAFVDWILTEAGQRSVADFVPDDGVPFGPVEIVIAPAEINFDGDVDAGAQLAAHHCGRCHRVSPQGRGIGIGSTPSFMALRALPDWGDRFTRFYALNPHPAFMLIAEVSLPFDPQRPPAIVPVLLTLDEVAAIQAYAATIPPADLGAPIPHQ